MAKKKEKDMMPETKAETRKDKIDAYMLDQRVLTEVSDPARELFNQNSYGKLTAEGKVQLSLIEALYLAEKGRISIKNDSGKEIKLDDFIKKAKRLEPNFWIRYCVFKDIRNRGYIIKTALKFGADFRVYDRGIKPGEDHAKWIIYPVHESSTITWYEFAAKNRVAHSTKKRLLIAIVDDEDDVTYYEIKWTRP
ncbi:MAG: tRNA-intron lyase [Candidatus Woesearchaeota archaeon]|nr:tRNA-intron lyase [Candidatus Woesearchaeota archaeon]